MANQFKLNDKVKTLKTIPVKLDGVVKYIACYDATVAGGRKCDKKNCKHQVKEFVWVRWVDGSVFSYRYDELASMAPAKSVTNNTPTVSQSYNKPNENSNPSSEEAKQKIENFKSKVEAKIAPANHIIQDDEIDWDAYNGFKRAPVRKQRIIR